MKTASEIRSQFLEFFARQGHTIVPSAPVVPYDDPTLLFTNAGMNQFKDVFLGTGKRSYSRAADTQKCIRVSGKHNDLEEVGCDTYHHTFFEMLGNWSFGDYFKHEAIEWAWRLLTEEWQVPKEKIWATVFGGDESEGLEPDEEAEKLWREHSDIPSERILRCGKKDNFWEMGDTGPCGPCTEIHIDLGPEADANEECRVNGPGSRYIEIWNLVFIQYNRGEDGKLRSLPAKHVDTGMGFERLVALLQNKFSNYDTDLFTPLISHIETLTDKKYGQDAAVDIAIRVISDHIRALSAAFADGALPGNSGRGYVLRRLLRRAARFGRQSLEMQEPFIHELIPTVSDILGEAFPEITQRQKHIALLVRSEEEAFSKMLSRGITIFDGLVQQVKQQGKNVVPGEKAYELYHQDGFPRDLVELMAREHQLDIDEQGWRQAEQEHIERSRSDKFGFDIPTAELEGVPATRFLGYSQFEGQGKIIKLIGTDKLILDRTTFYAEAGGQIGDSGKITGKGFRFEVHDTQKIGDIFIHIGELTVGDLASLPRWVSTNVDKQRRRKIMANHTATHLLHAALRKVLGDHVTQQGSLVAPDRLRFDVSHPQKITQEEIAEIEQIVNRIIYENIRVTRRLESLERAKEKGAMALFGEKYGEKVRVVTIGPHSMELCGGTHAFFTGNLGSFRITTETAVQAGVRRIEAVTRDVAVLKGQSEEALIQELMQQLKANEPKDLPARLASLQQEIKELRQKSRQDAQKSSKGQRDEFLDGAKEIAGAKLILRQVADTNAADLRQLADLLRKSGEPCLGLIASVQNEKILFVVFVADKLAEQKQLHAGEMLQKACAVIGGGGNSKRPDFAQGQGTQVAKLDEMFRELESFVEPLLAN